MLKSHRIPCTKRAGLIIAHHLKDTRPETFPRLSIRVFAAITTQHSRRRPSDEPRDPALRANRVCLNRSKTAASHREPTFGAWIKYPRFRMIYYFQDKYEADVAAWASSLTPRRVDITISAIDPEASVVNVDFTAGRTTAPFTRASAQQ